MKSFNLEYMLGWKVDILEKKSSKHVIIEYIEEVPMIVASLQCNSTESKVVYHVFERSNSDSYNPETWYLPIHKQSN